MTMAMSLVWNGIRTDHLFGKVGNENKEKFWTYGIAWNQKEGRCASTTSDWEEHLCWSKLHFLIKLTVSRCALYRDNSTHPSWPWPDSTAAVCDSFFINSPVGIWYSLAPTLLLFSLCLSDAPALDSVACATTCFAFFLHCFQSWIVVVSRMVWLWKTQSLLRYPWTYRWG